MSVFIDGFEQFDGYQAGRDRGSAISRAGYSIHGTVPSTVVGAGQQTALAITNGYIVRRQQWTTNVLSIGCAIAFRDRGALMALQFGEGDLLVLWTHPEDGTPRLNGVIGGSLPILDTWYYFEFEVNRSAGTATLFINNRQELVAPLSAEQREATEIGVFLGEVPSSTFNPDVGLPTGFQKSYDDFYIREGGRYGPVRIVTMAPGAWARPVLDPNETWGWWGAENPLQVLRRRPPEPNNVYIATDRLGDIVEFKIDETAMRQPVHDGDRVLATGLVALTRRAAGTTLRLRGYIGGSVSQRSAVVVPDGNWRLKYMAFETVGSDTRENINKATFGLESV